ncbi:MAG: hypothetical protein WBV94_09680 [Blastocatellia bacterium]
MSKKKEKLKSKALVKQAARDLGVEYQKGMRLGDLIQGEATRIVKQSAASVSSVDRDEDQWRGITQSRRDLQPIEQDRLLEIAHYLTAQNLLGAKIRKTRRDFIIGDGVTFQAEDKNEIQPLIEEFWYDPINNMDEFQVQIVDYLGIQGELFIPAFTNYFTGKVQLGWIDAYEVENVIPDAQNRRVMRQVKLKSISHASLTAMETVNHKRLYSVINVDLVPGSKSFNYRSGDMFRYGINCSPDATRGRSDYEPLADYIDAWDKATFNDLERVELLLNFIWDVKLTGKSEQEIEKWLETQMAPRPGSIRAHNENAEWEAVAPDLKFTETRMLANGIRKDVLGGADLSEFFFGITEGANRASSENLELPILKAFLSRQKIVKAVFRDFIDFAIDQKALKNRKFKAGLETGRIKRAFKVQMPELSTKDISRIGSVFSQATAALDMAVSRGWLRKETAARIFASLATQIGVEYDVDEEMKAVAKEKDADANQDYTPNRLEEAKKLKEVA